MEGRQLERALELRDRLRVLLLLEIESCQEVVRVRVAGIERGDLAERRQSVFDLTQIAVEQAQVVPPAPARSEERRVGKECRL